MNPYLELTKPRITGLVAVTAAAGFYLGTPGPLAWAGLIHVLVGTSLAAGGTNALNQWWEREADARMARTRRRPLPAGRIRPGWAFAFAAAVTAAGLAYLLTFTNALTMALAALSVVSYVLAYTPLKLRTPGAVLVGAVPGALPILGGWSAATGRVDATGAVLFLILFLWQLPHFLALAWLYREDYRAGGFRMLSLDDPDGRRTARAGLLGSAALVAASLLPSSFGLVQPTYLVAAVALGAGMLVGGAALTARPTRRAARVLFLASVVYLPLVLAALAATKART